MTRAANRERYGNSAELDLETYLTGVVPAEMNAEDPLEALKAQAIAARTYALRRALNRQSVDDTANCQAFRAERMGHARSQQAVRETSGIVLMYEGQLVQAYFSNSNGGMTKRSGDVWRTHLPYYVVRMTGIRRPGQRIRPSGSVMA